MRRRRGGGGRPRVERMDARVKPAPHAFTRAGSGGNSANASARSRPRPVRAASLLALRAYSQPCGVGDGDITLRPQRANLLRLLGPSRASFSAPRALRDRRRPGRLRACATDRRHGAVSLPDRSPVASFGVGLEAVKTGVFAPPALIGAMPFAGLRALVDEAIAALEALTPAEVNGWAGKTLNIALYRRSTKMIAPRPGRRDNSLSRRRLSFFPFRCQLSFPRRHRL